MKLINCKTFLFFIFGCLVSQKVLSQNDSIIYFFDKNLQFSDEPQASFVGIGIKKEGHLRFSNYTYPAGRLIMVGQFKDSTLASREGEFRYFDSISGRFTDLENYKDGLLHGYSVKLNDNDRVADSSYFEKGENLISIGYDYRGDKVKSRKVVDSKNHIKIFTLFSIDGDTVRHSYWVNGSGDDSEYYPGTHQKKDVYTYEFSRMVREAHYTKDGIEIPEKEYWKQRDQEAEEQKKLAEAQKPEYRGGYNQLGKDLLRMIGSLETIGGVTQNIRTFNLSFMLDKKGNPVDLVIAEISKESWVYTSFRDALQRVAANWDMKGREQYGPIRYALTIY